jgi:GH18 family chitinase
MCKKQFFIGIDVPVVYQYVDYYFLSATDYHGTWMVVTGVSTPNKEVVLIIGFIFH